MDNYSEEIYNAHIDIAFHLGIREVFLVQHIEGYYEMIEFNPIMGIENGREAEAAKLFHEHHTSADAEDEVFLTIARYIEKNQLSLFPDSAMFHVSQDFPLIGILMMISCMIFVLPYQIRERLARVTALHQTTQVGRELWKYQYTAVLLSSTIICIIQSLVFVSCLLLVIVGILTGVIQLVLKNSYLSVLAIILLGLGSLYLNTVSFGNWWDLIFSWNLSYLWSCSGFWFMERNLYDSFQGADILSICIQLAVLGALWKICYKKYQSKDCL